MSRRFGKKNEVSLNWYDYNMGLLGQSGIGKTTLAYELCHNELGEDGYILLNIGREAGVESLPNVIYEDVEDWGKFELIVNDIVKNKTKYYPELKIIVIDTIDEMVRLAKDEVVKRHNRLNPNKRVNSIKAAFGGYMAGEDMALDIFLEKVDELNAVGVHVLDIGHTKSRTKTDVITGEEYDELTAKLSNRDFEEIKTKLQVVGTAYIDRKIEGGRVISEKRVIAFRDVGASSVDCKSRFSEIDPVIDFDAKEFVRAIEDAIAIEYGKQDGAKKDIAKAKKEQTEEIEKAIEEEAEKSDNEEIKQGHLDIIQAGLQEGDKAKIKKLQEALKALEVSSVGDIHNLDIEILEKLASIFK